MASAKDLIVIDEKGNEIPEIDLADIDSALAGVRSRAPDGWSAENCYTIYKEWIKGKSPFEIVRDRKQAGLDGGIKPIVAAIQFMRYKVGLSIDPQVEQHKIVAYTKLVIGELTERLKESVSIVKVLDKAKKGFEDVLEAGTFDVLDPQDIGKYASILDLRQKEVRTLTALTAQLSTYNSQLSVLTGANIAAKKTANKQKAATLEDRLNNYDDATLHKLIEGFTEEVKEEFVQEEQEAKEIDAEMEQ